VDTSARDKSFQASDYVITNEAQINLDLKDVLEICIQKEDAAFRYYADMLQNAGDKETKETLLAIIEEEIKHKTRFEEVYDKLFKKH